MSQSGKKNCKHCKWHYRYVDWHYNDVKVRHKGKLVLTCHNGNQNCENFVLITKSYLKDIFWKTVNFFWKTIEDVVDKKTI